MYAWILSHKLLLLNWLTYTSLKSDLVDAITSDSYSITLFYVNPIMFNHDVVGSQTPNLTHQTD